MVVGHAFRNALIPIITVLGLDFGYYLTGSILTETIFSWPGLGFATYEAIRGGATGFLETKESYRPGSRTLPGFYYTAPEVFAEEEDPAAYFDALTKKFALSQEPDEVALVDGLGGGGPHLGEDDVAPLRRPGPRKLPWGRKAPSRALGPSPV